jgi:sugar lactone lactonase YvrE
MADEVRLLLDAKAELGEGPVWDGRRQVLYWVNILGKQVHVYDPKANRDRVLVTPEFVGCVAPRRRGGLVMALKDSFAAMDLESGQVTPLAPMPKPVPPQNRLNDGKCDPIGRFWAGTLAMDGAKEAASLYTLEPDLRVSLKLDKVGLSNGLAWTADARTMYFIDTRARAVAAFDYDAETGSIRNRRIVIDVPQDHGSPDGMTIDTEGMLWVAHWGGSRVQRWDPKSGKVLKAIRFPVSATSSCAFGGPNLDRLYVTSAWEGMSAEQRANEPLAGGLFVCDNPGARGYPAVEFAG